MASEKQVWRLFSSEALEALHEGCDVDLSDDELHYALHVLRLAKGETVEVGDGDGRIARGQISHSDKRRCSVRIDSVESRPRPALKVVVCLALPKPATLEDVVFQASEMGATELHVFRTQKSQFKSEPKQDKLRRQALEALRVNKAAWATDVHVHADFGAFLDSWNPDDRTVAFLCDESPLNPENRSAGLVNHNGLHRALAALGRDVKCIALFIGPEASFTAEERSALMERAGAQPVSLGERILRVPTAVATALALTLAHCD